MPPSSAIAPNLQPTQHKQNLPRTYSMSDPKPRPAIPKRPSRKSTSESSVQDKSRTPPAVPERIVKDNNSVGNQSESSEISESKVMNKDISSDEPNDEIPKIEKSGSEASGIETAAEPTSEHDKEIETPKDIENVIEEVDSKEHASISRTGSQTSDIEKPPIPVRISRSSTSSDSSKPEKPAIPERPKKLSRSGTLESDSGKPPKPAKPAIPPKPKKLPAVKKPSSKILAFQNMLSQQQQQNQSKLEPVARKPDEQASKKRAEFQNNLNGLFGVALPGMALSKESLKAPEEPKTEVKDEEPGKLSDVRSRRARGGPKRRLPASATKAVQVKKESGFEICVDDLWEVVISKNFEEQPLKAEEENSPVIDPEDRIEVEDIDNDDALEKEIVESSEQTHSSPASEKEAVEEFLFEKPE